MPTLKVNEIVSYSGNTLSLGTTGDTINVASGVTFNTANATVNYPAGSISNAAINASAAIAYSKLNLSNSIVNADISSTAAITLNKLSGNPTFRNIVINGDMQIAQRNTSVASITTESYYTIDRFITNITTLGTWTQSQSTDVPSGYGFSKSLKMDCTTADASPAAGDLLILAQRFEGQNLQYLKKGTANAVSLTASFWVKSTKTGTHILELYDNDNSRSISKSYTVSVSNTWEFKTVTFAGDTTGVLDNDNGVSLILHFWLGAGTTYTSGTLNTSWAASTNANRAVGQVNCADSTANDFLITGVQLEAGTSATDFEFLPIDVSLGRCQRYFEKLYNLTTVPADGATNYTTGGAAGEASWTCFETSQIGSGTRLKVEKRTTPTITLFRTSDVATAGAPAYYNDSNVWTAVTPSTVYVLDSLGFYIRSSITATKGRSYLFAGGWTASAEL
jgi:hypothetical protein